MWYYLVRIKGCDFVRGPFSTQEILDKIYWGDVVENTLVRFGSRSQWREATEFSDLEQYFNDKISKKRTRKYVKNSLSIFIIFFIVSFLVFRYNHTQSNNLHNEDVGGSELRVESIREPIVFSATKEGIIRETNKARINVGLYSLVENDLLNQIADERISDMFKNQYFGHESPSGKGYSELAIRYGYPFKRLSENIASMTLYSSDQKFLNLWMQSPGHRSNILDTEVREIGVAVKKGYLNGNDTWVSVQVFGLQSEP